MDDMQMEWMRTKDTLSHNVVCVHKVKVFEKNSRVRCVCLHPRRWIPIDCKRNQLQQKEDHVKIS